MIVLVFAALAIGCARQDPPWTLCPDGGTQHMAVGTVRGVAAQSVELEIALDPENSRRHRADASMTRRTIEVSIVGTTRFLTGHRPEELRLAPGERAATGWYREGCDDRAGRVIADWIGRH